VEYGTVVVVDALASVDLGPTEASASAVYDRPIGIRSLYEDPVSGEEHYLVRYPAGVRGRLHRHTAAHTIIVLDGKLRANGRVVGPGAYAHYPAGEAMQHEAAGDDEGCLFVLIFHGPFDVEMLEGA
jgi:quercetin dioxygenase-like cupin family protein